MGAQPRNLGRFLLNLLDNGEVSGLEWIHRDSKLFKIPWIDKRNPAWGTKGHIIPKKWEIYNDRYQAGDPEQWNEWKQKFRGALNKSPYVTAVPERHEKKHPTMPFLVYQFTEKINIHEPNAIMKKNRSKKSPNNSQGGAGIETDVQFSPQQTNGLCPLTDNVDIPQVVLDELSNVNYNDDVFDESCPNYRTCPEKKNGEQSSPYDNTPQSSVENMDTGFDLENLILNSPFGVQPNPMETCDPNPLPCPIPSGNPMTAVANIPHVKFRAYYLKHNFILEGTIGNEGVCLSSRLKSRTLNNQLKMGNMDPQLYEKIRGPGYFNQVELPNVPDQILNKSDPETCDKLQDIVDEMERGVLLFYVQQKLFVFRKCRTHVYASLGNNRFFHIDRKNKNEYLLFDINYFKNELELFNSDPENNVCPSPTVTLTFGTRQGIEPFVHLDLTVLEAENMLRRNRPDILISGLDSGDLLLERFNSLALNNSNLGFECDL